MRMIARKSAHVPLDRRCSAVAEYSMWAAIDKMLSSLYSSANYCFVYKTVIMNGNL